MGSRIIRRSSRGRGSRSKENRKNRRKPAGSGTI